MIGTEATRDDEIRARCEANDFDGAAEAALKAWGAEVFGFLVALCSSATAADDAFAVFAEDVWRGLPSFRWECSLRTWLYQVARHAATRTGRSERRGDALRAPVGVSAVASRIAGSAQGPATLARSERSQRIAELRATLPPDDQTLLILRVDRELSWDDLARVMTDEPDLDGEALARESARLRKRFQLVKDRLRTLAREAGLVE